jgi:hypothetical protein
VAASCWSLTTSLNAPSFIPLAETMASLSTINDNAKLLKVFQFIPAIIFALSDISQFSN